MPIRIAFQGEPGAYSEAGALAFDSQAETVPCASFEDVFAAIETGIAAYGVVPIENSIGGSIHQNYDLLLQHELPIVAEVQLRIRHALLAAAGTSLDQVRRVYSHPQALAQCERFLRSLSGVELVATYDTAGSAKMIRDEQLSGVAAIASERAGRLFGLDVLQFGIEDFADNITRFLVIARQPDRVPRAAADKTGIVFALPNEPGSLFKALSVFALRNIDLLKLESRPIRGRPWEYLFYADLSVARDDPRCQRALLHLAEFAKWLRTLGSYPAASVPAAEPAEEQP